MNQSQYFSQEIILYMPNIVNYHVVWLFISMAYMLCYHDTISFPLSIGAQCHQGRKVCCSGL